MPFSPKLALITGASSGIGESLALLLADQGVNLILHGRNRGNLESLAKKIESKVTVEIVTADLALAYERQKVAEVIYSKKPDLVINNAGFGLYGKAVDYIPQEELQIIEVNGSAVLELTLEAARTMIASGIKGVILNVSSSAGEIPISPGFSVYSAVKAMVNRFSQSLDIELKNSGIRVLVSCPGFVRTKFRQRAGGAQEDSVYQRLAMTSEYAAEQVWWQIQQLKPFYIFDWKTRWLVFATKLFPKKWVAYVYRKRFS